MANNTGPLAADRALVWRLGQQGKTGYAIAAQATKKHFAAYGFQRPRSNSFVYRWRRECPLRTGARAFLVAKPSTGRHKVWTERTRKRFIREFKLANRTAGTSLSEFAKSRRGASNQAGFEPKWDLNPLRLFGLNG